MTRKQTWKIRRIPSSVPMGQDFPSSGRRFPPTCIWSPASARPLRPPNPLPRPDAEVWTTGSWRPSWTEFGPIRRPVHQPSSPPPAVPTPEPGPPRKEYLIVDGYNILFAWEELAHLAREDLEMARNRLMDILSNYCGYKTGRSFWCLTAIGSRAAGGERFRYHNLYVVYTRENETGDMYIEALVPGHRIPMTGSGWPLPTVWFSSPPFAPVCCGYPPGN